jgi:hypothetical protein
MERLYLTRDRQLFFLFLFFDTSSISPSLLTSAPKLLSLLSLLSLLPSHSLPVHNNHEGISYLCCSYSGIHGLCLSMSFQLGCE